MNTLNFQNLIRLITKRNFIIKTEEVELSFETEYRIYHVLPETGSSAGFYWKTPKSDEKMLRSFITSFCNKYREPDPKKYDYEYGGRDYTWAEKSAKEKEYCYVHHASNMYSKGQLLEQIENNFSDEHITSGLIRYGFYPTEYGVGIFCYFMTNGVQNAIDAMKKFLSGKSIPFTNEFSDARWVYRFKLGLSKELHTSLINELKD